MNQPEESYNAISSDLCNYPDVSHGKMMSSPALKFKENVFAFFNKDAMGFRLGPAFDPKSVNIRNAKPLSPFKKSPPLNGWLTAEFKEAGIGKYFPNSL